MLCEIVSVLVSAEFFMCVENVSRSGKPYRTNDAGKLRRGKKSSAASAHTHTHEIHARQKEKKPRDEEKEQGGHRRDDVGEVQYESERETAELVNKRETE